MPKNICEKYDATKNEWSIIHIENALNLSGFGWCETQNPGEIFVLGGSDGMCMTSSLWKIDFNSRKATYMNAEYDTSTSMTKLIHYDNTLYAFGGSNSDGSSYTLKLTDKDPTWKLYENSYLLLYSNPQSTLDSKFMFRSSIYLR